MRYYYVTFFLRSHIQYQWDDILKHLSMFVNILYLFFFKWLRSKKALNVAEETNSSQISLALRTRYFMILARKGCSC